MSKARTGEGGQKEKWRRKGREREEEEGKVEEEGKQKGRKDKWREGRRGRITKEKQEFEIRLDRW